MAYTREQWEQRINEAGDGWYEFVRWAAEGLFGSHEKCVVRCRADGYEWSAKPNSLVDGGKGCPQCSGVRRWTEEERIAQINSLENILFLSWVDGYKNSHSKANLRCSIDGHVWDSSVNNLVNNGRGCPQCAGRRRWTASDRISQVNATNKMKFVSWLDGYNGKDSKANVICNTCEHEWRASIGSIVNNGSGCPRCAGKIPLSIDEWKSRVIKSGCGKFIFVCWHGEFIGAHSMAKFRCLVDNHEWISDINHIFRGRSGCPECAKNKRYSPEEYEIAINNSGVGRFVFVKWAGNTKRAKSKAVCRCLSCDHNWSASVDSLTRISGCPRCAKYGFQLDKTGYLYALRSECGKYVKVGISNNPSQRHKQLELATPFGFSCIEQFEDDGAKIAELEKYFHGKYERAGFAGYDGATEWLVCTPQLLEELRTIGDK